MAGGLQAFEVFGTIDLRGGAKVMSEITAIGSASKKGLVPGLTAGALAVSALTAAVGIFAVKSALDMKQAQRVITQGTGATGTALAKMTDDFKAVFATVPEEVGTVADALVAVEQLSGSTGANLQAMTKQYVSLARMQGGDAKALAKDGIATLNQWGVATGKQADTLDRFYRISQKTGAPVESLLGMLKTFGPVFRPLGLGLDESASLLGAMTKAGLNTSKMTFAFRSALVKLGKDGVKDTAKGFLDLVQRIKDAKTQSDATALSVKYFGARGVELGLAIYSGKVQLDGIVASMESGKGTITGTADSTMKFADQMKSVGHEAGIAIEPLGNVILQFRGPLMDVFRQGIGALKSFGNWFAALGKPTQTAIVKLGLFMIAAGPLLKMAGPLWGVAKAIGGIGSAAATAAGAEGAGGLAAGITAMGVSTGPVLLAIAAIAAAVGGITLAWRMAHDEWLLYQISQGGGQLTSGTTPSPKDAPGVGVGGGRYRSNEGQVTNPGVVGGAPWLTPHTVGSSPGIPTVTVDPKAAAKMADDLLRGYAAPIIASQLPAQAGGFLAKHTIDAAKVTLGEQSPSTVFRDIGTNAVLGMLSGLTPGAVWAAVTRLAGGMVARIVALPGQFGHTAAVTIGNFAGGVAGGVGSAWSQASRLASGMVARVSGISSQFVRAGVNAAWGLAAGVGEGVDAVWSAGVNLAKKLIGAVKNFLGIHSPSTVFAGIGSHVVSGFVNGLNFDNAMGIVKKFFGGVWQFASSVPSILSNLFQSGDIGSVMAMLNNVKGGVGGALGNVFAGIKEARSLIGQPYVWGGLDCSGLASSVLNAVFPGRFGRFTTADVPSMFAPGPGKLITLGLVPGKHMGIKLPDGWYESPHTGATVRGPGSAKSSWPTEWHIPGYRTGGMVFDTGPAMLHGTKSRPEAVLSYEAIKEALSGGPTNTFTGNLIFNTAAAVDRFLDRTELRSELGALGVAY